MSGTCLMLYSCACSRPIISWVIHLLQITTGPVYNGILHLARNYSSMKLMCHYDGKARDTWHVQNNHGFGVITAFWLRCLLTSESLPSTRCIWVVVASSMILGNRLLSWWTLVFLIVTINSSDSCICNQAEGVMELKHSLFTLHTQVARMLCGKGVF